MFSFKTFFSITLMCFINIVLVNCEELCFTEEFNDFNTGILNSVCTGEEELFVVKKYEDSLVPPPDQSNGYFLSSPNTVSSCISTGIPIETKPGTRVTLRYYIRGKVSGGLCVMLLEPSDVVLPILIDNSKIWYTKHITIPKQTTNSIKIICGDMKDKQLAIDFLRVETDPAYCESATNLQ